MSQAALFIDGFVILVYFVAIVGIGLYAGRGIPRYRNLP